MNKALADLIRISKTTGKDPDLVQGGGGNTSIKTPDGKYMYIKASGTALKDMDKKIGWRRLKLDAVTAIVSDSSIAKLETQAREVEIVNRLLLSCDDNVKTGARPSVEAHLHSFLDKCVIHLHPSAVGAYVNTKNGKALIAKLFKDQKLPPLWIPYADPGFMLARKIAALIEDYKKQYGSKPTVLFLEKHGLFVSATTPNVGLKIVKMVIKLCNSKLKKPAKPSKLKPVDTQKVSDAKLAIRGAFFKATGNYSNVNYFYDNDIAAFLRRKDAPKLLAPASLAPDELVYANGPAMWVDTCDTKKIAAKLNRQLDNSMKPSVSFMVKGVGLFILGTEKIAPTIFEIAKSSLFIRTNAAALGGIACLNKRQQDFINQWEAEAFRKKLATGASVGDLENRLAVVTGAGSGLGKSIAIGLAKAGASVAIADIDTNAAQQTADFIKKQFPQSSAVAISCNVTSETSIRQSFDQLLKKFGGLDIMVNAAGVAPAYSLVDLPVDKWRFTLEVNLTGYFLCAQAAARIMIKQAIGGSIVNISSKSGLEASKNNTPYNATKAGEIHMARGWAMELGEHGIRVNSVCPGNVFEGSKIWNPEYIKVCAKKYGIKPEEVIPYYVGKTHLKREIKGSDIADSVVFLCSEKARTITGQTIVADSGQVMVR